MFCVHVVLPYAKAILFRLFGDHVYVFGYISTFLMGRSPRPASCSVEQHDNKMTEQGQ